MPHGASSMQLLSLRDAVDERKTLARRIMLGIGIGLGALVVVGAFAVRAINRSVDRDAWQ